MSFFVSTGVSAVILGTVDRISGLVVSERSELHARRLSAIIVSFVRLPTIPNHREATSLPPSCVCDKNRLRTEDTNNGSGRDGSLPSFTSSSYGSSTEFFGILGPIGIRFFLLLYSFKMASVVALPLSEISAAAQSTDLTSWMVWFGRIRIDSVFVPLTLTYICVTIGILVAGKQEDSTGTPFVLRQKTKIETSLTTSQHFAFTPEHGGLSRIFRRQHMGKQKFNFAELLLRQMRVQITEHFLHKGGVNQPILHHICVDVEHLRFDHEQPNISKGFHRGCRGCQGCQVLMSWEHPVLLTEYSFPFLSFLHGGNSEKRLLTVNSILHYGKKYPSLGTPISSPTTLI
ncbi:hypothetical protein BC830DRAFT_828919 [Chytriomyces sp. MP71]|nr:hypothetical protein BC830DRAFT_828919 [Chytriomyces sp. MP71]